MNTLARLVYRCDGKNGGIFIGAGAIGQNFFEHNAVYEVVEILGQTMIRKLGKSTIREVHEATDDSLEIPCINWGWRIDDIIDEGGRDLWLTREEYVKIIRDGESD